MSEQSIAAELWARPGPTARERRNDVLSGAGLVLLTLASLALGLSAGVVPADVRPGLAESLVWVLLTSLPLVMRRRFPLSTLVVVALAFIGGQARFVPEQTMASIALFLAIFTVGAWGRDRQLGRWLRILVIAAMFAWLVYAASSTSHGYRADAETYKNAAGPLPPVVAVVVYSLLINTLYFLAAYAFGTSAWTQARQRHELTERNAELAAERDLNARRAVVAERLRIARELHDVVAHHVSLMGIQAAAARRVLDRDPGLARSTLEEVESTGRQAVDEMHRLLGVLRAPEQDGAVAPGDGVVADEPARGVEGLAELAGRADTAGVDTRFTRVGQPFEIPPGVSVSAYRVAQEAVTNAVRHAAARRVDVRLRYLPGAVEVEVVDDGRGVPALAGSPPPARVGTAQRPGGMGLVGMRERVAVHGGELELGNRTEGGFRVRARFPVPAAAERARSGVPA